MDKERRKQLKREYEQRNRERWQGIASSKSSASGDWREQFEIHAEANKMSLDEKSVSELLQNVASGSFGQYFNIWYSIAERADAKEALPVLFSALESNNDYLQQYHCAVAILHLLSVEKLVDGSYPSNTSAVEYTTSGKNYHEARRNLEKLINAKTKRAMA